MNLPLLALFTRSLQEDARAAATYWARGALAAFILIIVAGMAASNSWGGAPGKTFFISIISLQTVSITLVGLSYFCSVITEEKEEQTLGLLRMTDLNPLSILLGKSTSRLCGALLLLIAQLPFTIFAITYGGISLAQIIASYCALGAYTFLLCNVALLGSVIARRTGGAATFTVIVVGFLLSSGPLLGWLHSRLGSYGIQSGLKPLADRLWDTTLIAHLIEILGTGFARSPAGLQVASNLALGVLCFLIAWAVFGRCCDRAPAESASAAPARKILGLSVRRPPRPQARALHWKDFHFLHGGRIGLIIRIVGYGGAAAFACLEMLRRSGTIGFSAAGSLVSFVYSIDLAILAARMFGTEIRDQTLSALATLPLTLRQIAYRKSLVLMQFALPGAIAVITCGVLTIVSFTRAIGGSGAPPSYSTMIIGQTLSNWLNIVFLVHVVAWLSLFVKRGAVPIGYVAAQAFHTIIAIGGIAVGSLFGASRNGSLGFVSLSALLGIGASLGAIIILHYQSLRRLEAVVSDS